MVVTAYLVREAHGAATHEMEAFPVVPRKRKAASCADLVGKRIMWQGEKMLRGARSQQWYPGKVTKRVGEDAYLITWQDLDDISMVTTRSRENLSRKNMSDSPDAPHGSWYMSAKK